MNKYYTKDMIKQYNKKNNSNDFNKNIFNSQSKVYAFTNEALSLYMNNYDFKEKNVLASLGSGDFALNAYILGAKEVETFDINQVAYFFFELKKALIIAYNFDEICFLIKNPTKIFEKFNEYQHLLNPLTINFFKNLINEYKDNTKELLKNLFIDRILSAKKTWKNLTNAYESLEELFLISQYKNFYLSSEENYNKLKEQLLKHYNDSFYFVNLYHFKSTKKYDIVYLSNIGDYYDSVEEFNKFIKKLSSELLTEDGIIIITSITNQTIINQDHSEIIKIDISDMEKFNMEHEGIAYLPIDNLANQTIYTVHNQIEKKNIH